MIDLLESLCEYRALVAETGPLDDADRARLLGLAQVLGAEPPWRARETASRVELSVSFTSAGGFGSGTLHSVTGEGMVIATRSAPTSGARTIVRVAQRGVEYVFPARLVWRAMGKNGAMGVVFDGPPTRSADHDLLGATSSALWANRALFGRGDPMLA